MFEKEYKPTATMEQYLAAIDENADFRDISQLDEIYESDDYKVSHEKHAKGYRAALVHKDGHTSFTGSTIYKSKEHAEGEAKVYLDAKRPTSNVKSGSRHVENTADRALWNYRKKANAAGHIVENNELDEASHRQDFMQLNPDMKEKKSLKDKIIAATKKAANVIAPDDETLMKNLKKKVSEEVEDLDEKTLTPAELKKREDTVTRDTQGKVISYRHEGKWHHDGEKKDGRGKVTHMSDVARRKMEKLTKEELELEEGMISYSDFTNKIKSHRAAGNKIVDDKYQDGKASYTVIDSEGVGKKITHTHTGSKQEHLGNLKGDDDQANVKTQEKRGRGRPVGSKSGARR